jgi:hypothetical protein
MPWTRLRDYTRHPHALEEVGKSPSADLGFLILGQPRGSLQPGSIVIRISVTQFLIYYYVVRRDYVQGRPFDEVLDRIALRTTWRLAHLTRFTLSTIRQRS